MKTKSIVQMAAALLLSTFNLQLSTAFAQGSLTPPGAPAPTMKSLDQIEPRTPIPGAGAVTITSPGSYYLTGDLVLSSGNAITITSDNVTLDLNGFSIVMNESPPNGTGILLSGGRFNISIRNGHIRGGVTQNNGNFTGSGFGYGIYYGSGAPANVHVANVSVSGGMDDGINLSTLNASVVESCTVNTVGGNGIYADSVANSSAQNCGSSGIYANTVHNCVGVALSGGYGVIATVAQNCYGLSLDGTGLNTDSAENCFGVSSSGTGLYANFTVQNCYGQSGGSDFGLAGNGTAINCYGYSTTGIGLDDNNVQNCYGGSGGSAIGLAADIAAVNCSGQSVGGAGLNCNGPAQNCSGSSTTGIGLNAYNAVNCSGVTTSGTYGLFVQNTADSCYGSTQLQGGTGLEANIATGCTGYAFGQNGTGLSATIASFCACGATPNGTDIYAGIANSCYVPPSGGSSIAYKYNMP